MSIMTAPPAAKAGDVIEKSNDLGDIARVATEWVEAEIGAVKSAPNNPYGEDDEAIAGEILRRLAPGKMRPFRPQDGA